MGVQRAETSGGGEAWAALNKGSVLSDKELEAVGKSLVEAKKNAKNESLSKAGGAKWLKLKITEFIKTLPELVGGKKEVGPSDYKKVAIKFISRQNTEFVQKHFGLGKNQQRDLKRSGIVPNNQILGRDATLQHKIELHLFKQAVNSQGKDHWVNKFTDEMDDEAFGKQFFTDTGQETLLKLDEIAKAAPSAEAFVAALDNAGVAPETLFAVDADKRHEIISQLAQAPLAMDLEKIEDEKLTATVKTIVDKLVERDGVDALASDEYQEVRKGVPDLLSAKHFKPETFQAWLDEELKRELVASDVGQLGKEYFREYFREHLRDHLASGDIPGDLELVAHHLAVQMERYKIAGEEDTFIEKYMDFISSGLATEDRVADFLVGLQTEELERKFPT